MDACLRPSSFSSCTGYNPGAMSSVKNFFVRRMRTGACRIGRCPKHRKNGDRVNIVVGKKERNAVGKPVARLTPHRSLREVFPHKAHRSDSLPCQGISPLSCYSPQGPSVRLASVSGNQPPELLFPTVKLTPIPRPCMPGRSFLCGLRPSVSPFSHVAVLLRLRLL